MKTCQNHAHGVCFVYVTSHVVCVCVRAYVNDVYYFHKPRFCLVFFFRCWHFTLCPIMLEWFCLPKCLLMRSALVKLNFIQSMQMMQTHVCSLCVTTTELQPAASSKPVVSSMLPGATSCAPGGSKRPSRQFSKYR